MLRLRITWDDRELPSVDAPVALFFGAGTLYSRDRAEYLVKAFPVHVRFTGGQVELASYFPMPFFKSARIELVGNGEAALNDMRWATRRVPYRGPANHVGYFHATYRDHGKPTPGKDLVLLDTRRQENSAVWSGSLVGTSFIFSDRANLRTLEGDPRFFFDDSRTPQAQGTGTEEWGGGGDYWGGLNMTLPSLAIRPAHRSPKEAKEPEDQIESAYRFLLGDLMPFGKNARHSTGARRLGRIDGTLPDGHLLVWLTGRFAGANRFTADRRHGQREAARVRLARCLAAVPDHFDFRSGRGPRRRQVDRAAADRYGPQDDGHLGIQGQYRSGQSGCDAPSQTGLQLPESKGGGVRGRRRRRHRRAAAPATWKPAGVWYLAGANTCVYSNPKEELGPAEHKVRTSNRRFRDDEFLLPLELTKGRSVIRVRVVFTPVHIPLYPGRPEGELAWSEIRYDAYCFVMPDISRAAKGSD